MLRMSINSECHSGSRLARPQVVADRSRGRRCIRELQIRHHRIMVRIREGKLPALEHRQTGVRQNVVYPQRRGYMNVSTANTKTFCDIGVLPIATDGKISIGVGDIIEITAYEGGIRTFIQLRPNLFGLVSPLAKGVTKLFDDGT